ncbi:GNAT family N-acetyltransferase [Streptomyces sp. NBC_00250]|uniref:GNAT family N-acetyltransferase n=1 Tax=Streptomyces sp. NBC_00250 TaxID=2903641 RepID=UPI002E2D0A78|nr:GNAT family N-acetyltransferase [Streptomyces sp. NBC_00250]
MTDDPLLVRARGLWETLADVPVSFASLDGPAVVVSPTSALCPPSWAGLVVLGGAAIVTAPTVSAAGVLRRALASVPTDSLTRPEKVQAVLPVSEVLGPATLAYLSGADFRPAPADGTVEHLDPGHPSLQGLLRSAGPDDVAESGVEEITSPVFVVREGTEVVAAAGYRAWPAETAHVCVLTHPQWRGRHLARQVASAAVAHALTVGLLPQWRARPPASRRVARSLGFRELGSQLSFRLDLEADL